MSDSVHQRPSAEITGGAGHHARWLVSCLALALVLLYANPASAKAGILAGILLAGGTVAALALSYFTLKSAHGAQMHRLLAAMAAEQQARAEAEMALREKTRLLATVSHEIRTPLNGVIGMLGLLLETPLSLEQRNYAATANSSGRILLSIVDEILDTAKTQATQNDHSGRIDLVSVLENVAELLAPRAHAKGIEISCHVALDVPPEIPGDDLRLRQVLFNLAGNAIKFTASGGVALEARIEDGTALVIDVWDTGIGMTTDEAQRVFREFTQANAETQRRFGGTGLGLSISASLVEAMGGSLRLSSSPGKGSKFTLRFPLPEDAAAPEPAPQPLSERHFHLALKPGIFSNHLARGLEELGARTSWISSARNFATLLADKNGQCDIIADSLQAATLLRWARRGKKNRPSSLHNIWVLLKADERREYRQLLQAPFAGYLLNPLRRTTILAQLGGVPQPTHAAQQAPTAARQPAARKLNVLLAEDNPVNALLARTLLERLGHSVTLVGDGEAALAKLDDGHDFDLCLLDMEMPGLGGLSTTRQIRQREEKAGGPRLAILALTANARPEDVASCLASGMDGHLSKPFDQLDIDEKINSLNFPVRS
jgi:signal transduction histidine kinase/CheY-like chemotaxis protein